MDPSVYVWKSEPVGGEYTPDLVSDASYGMLSALGLQAGARKRVLIKPNVTIAVGRESGIDTDCAHVEGIVRWLLDNGWPRERVAIGEGGGQWMPYAFHEAGFTDVACAHGIELVSFNDLRIGYVENKCPFTADRIEVTGRRQRIARRVLDPDTFVINAPKLKTHNAMAISICLKNLMGTQHRHDRGLCGISMEYAARKSMDYERRFAHEMCNLYAAVHPDYNLVDGVISRMGSGFQDGENYPLGLTVAGVDGFAVDFACAYFMGLNPERLLLFQVAAAKGLAPRNIRDLDIRLVTRDSIRPVSARQLGSLCSRGGFWVKYHREGRKRPRRLEEYYPGVYHRPVLPRRQEQRGA